MLAGKEHLGCGALLLAELLPRLQARPHCIF